MRSSNHKLTDDRYRWNNERLQSDALTSVERTLRIARTDARSIEADLFVQGIDIEPQS